MIDSILTRSLSGPKPRIAIGIIPCETNCSNAKTRPIYPFSVLVWIKTVSDAISTGTNIPQIQSKIRYTQKTRDSPISAKVQPNTANETAIIVILFLNSPFQATNAPPKRARPATTAFHWPSVSKLHCRSSLLPSAVTKTPPE